MVDCGNTRDFNPIDFLLAKNLIPENKLSNLTLTNYDQDHFSGIVYLRERVKIETVNFPKNMTGKQIKESKSVITAAVEEIVKMKEEFSATVENYDPPYRKYCYSLNQADFPGENIDTNKLSQLVFVSFNNTVVCIPGDLTTPAWEKLLQLNDVKTLLGRTNIFIASHHGREDGYCKDVFTHCKPEVIILSDKDIIHETQKGQTQLYSTHVMGEGVNLNSTNRKTLTTRSDGHLWIRIQDDGSRSYKTLSI